MPQVMRANRSAAVLAVMSLFAVAVVGCEQKEKPTAPPAPGATLTMQEYSYHLAGEVKEGGAFRVVNAGREFHMVALARLKTGRTFEEARAALQTPERSDDTAVAEDVAMPGGFMGPGSTVEITAPGLFAGNYLMACFINVEGEETFHFERGMVAPFAVGAPSGSPAPSHDATYVATRGRPITGPATLEPGRRVLRIERTAGSEELEPALVKLNDGATLDQLGEALKSFDQLLPKDAANQLPAKFVVSLFDFRENAAVYVAADMEPGRYVLTAEDTDDADKPAVPLERTEITVT